MAWHSKCLPGPTVRVWRQDTCTPVGVGDNSGVIVRFAATGARSAYLNAGSRDGSDKSPNSSERSWSDRKSRASNDEAPVKSLKAWYSAVTPDASSGLTRASPDTCVVGVLMASATAMSFGGGGGAGGLGGGDSAGGGGIELFAGGYGPTNNYTPHMS